MRIVVNNIAASVGGAMTVLRDFYACVCEYGKEHEWIFLLNDKYFDERENVKIITLREVKKNPVKKLTFDLFTGKKYIERLKPDVVFSMQNIITFGVKVPQVVYVHQSLPFQHAKKFSFFKADERSIAIKQRIVGKIIKKSIKSADHVIVQTDWIKKAVCQECAVPSEKITKCKPACMEMVSTDQSYQFNPGHFYYPTSTGVYKNNQLVFEASAILDARGIKHHIELTINPDKSCGSVMCIGRIPFVQVIEKYQTATLVFPSYIETFGYPLAEARQMGAIVLAADTPFARELLDGYENAYFFKYDRADQLAELMEKVVLGEIQKRASNYTAEVAESENCWIPVMSCVLESAQERYPYEFTGTER